MVGGLPTETVSFLVATARTDVIRAALGLPTYLNAVRTDALERVLQEFGRGITPEELQEARERQRTSPRPVLAPDTNQELPGGSQAAGEVVATFLQPNYLVNEVLLEQLQADAAAAVELEPERFVEEQEIVAQGQILTDFHIAAIEATRAPSVAGEASGGLLAVVATVAAATYATGRRVPLQCSVTLDPTGRMLLGTDIRGALATLEAMGADVIGLNCSTGPDLMRDAVRWLSQNAGTPIHCIPNAGLPINDGGRTVYPMKPAPMAETLVPGPMCELSYRATARVRSVRPVEVPAYPRTSRTTTWSSLATSSSSSLPVEIIRAGGAMLPARRV